MSRRPLFVALGVCGFVLGFWASRTPGDPVRVVIPAGATFSEAVDSLEAAGVIGARGPFSLLARVRGADRSIKAGTYDMAEGMRWSAALRQITRGEVVTLPLTIPEGFRLAEMAPRIAGLTGVSEEVVRAELERPGAAEALGLPGPTLEGYLFPDTYRFASGVPVRFVVEVMAKRYRDVWTPERRELREASGRTEREIATLASIVQAEARHVSEMPRIAGVYHNRLRSGWRLQADPTVIYALGGYRERLLYAAIDSVQDNPYNTYTQAGLPPGPIGAPGEAALDAALSPEGHDYMYFVAAPDGTHVFTRTLQEHNRARADVGRPVDGSNDR